MVQKATAENAESVVLTFDPHPRQVLFGEDSGLKLLQTLDQRIQSLAKTGLDHLVIQPFDRTFSILVNEEDFVVYNKYESGFSNQNAVNRWEYNIDPKHNINSNISIIKGTTLEGDNTSALLKNPSFNSHEKAINENRDAPNLSQYFLSVSVLKSIPEVDNA